jgi:exosortase A-associated hydrolase 2
LHIHFMTPKHEPALSAQFLEGGSAARPLLTTHSPSSPARAWLLAIPPFAEEMMKARQQFTQLARELGEFSIGTVVLDVRGTGDAEGELVDLTWEDWCVDVANAYEKLANTGLPVFVLGLRLGALLSAISLEKRAFCAAGIVLWEPQFSGKLALKPFLRMGAMSAKFSGREQENTESGAQEIGGYMLSGAFQDSVNDAIAPSKLPASAGLIVKISPETGAEPPPAWNAVLASWKENGAQVEVENVTFPAFWNTTEIVASAALSEKTRAWIVARLSQ